MTGVGWGELVLLFVIGLLVLGPERLPRVASQIGRWVGRARRTANQLRHQLEREIALSEINKPRPPTQADGKEPSKHQADSGETDGNQIHAEEIHAEQRPEGETAQSADEAAGEPSPTADDAANREPPSPG